MGGVRGSGSVWGVVGLALGRRRRCGFQEAGGCRLGLRCSFVAIVVVVSDESTTQRLRPVVSQWWMVDLVKVCELW